MSLPRGAGPAASSIPQLIAPLAKDDRIRLVGINYKDVPANAVRFLDELGNLYAAIGVDRSGRAAIDWGVYGVPETFIVDGDGIIRHKHIGPIDAAALEATVLPAIEAALKPVKQGCQGCNPRSIFQLAVHLAEYGA